MILKVPEIVFGNFFEVWEIEEELVDLGFVEGSTSVILEEVLVEMTGTKSLETWDLMKGFESQTFLNITKSKNGIVKGNRFESLEFAQKTLYIPLKKCHWAQ